jgi:ADP-heptose:LPS heptosyltransferase
LGRDFQKSYDDLVSAAASGETAEKLRKGVACEAGLPLRTVAAMLRHCSVLAGNDSGPKHLAVAAEIPTVTLFGPEHPFEWHPYPQDRHPYFFIENLSCRQDADPGKPPWCAKVTCVEERHRCMREIGVDQVLRECQRVKQG